jgi:hypothetical protein
MPSSELESDYTLPPGQLFACLSYVGPDAPQKCDHFGIKIRGVFPTQAEAAKHAQRLQKEDTTFDIYVVDVGKWLLLPPPKDIEDSHYADAKLEELMVSYRESQVEAAKLFNERKRDMTTGTTIKPGDENSKFYSKPDEAPVPTPGEVLERLQKERPDAPIEELVEEANKIVAEEIEERRKARQSEVEPVETDTKE